MNKSSFFLKKELLFSIEEEWKINGRHTEQDITYPFFMLDYKLQPWQAPLNTAL